MNAQDDKMRFEDELSDALGADDVFAALGELARRHDGDAGTLERIEAARRLVGELTSVGGRLAGSPVPPMQELDLPARPQRVRPWRIAIPAATAAATAVAAAVLLAVFLTRPPAPTTRTTVQVKVAATAPVESAWLAAMSECGGFTLPKVESPQWPSLELPAVSMPTISGLGDTEFSIPTFNWPELTERSTNDES